MYFLLQTLFLFLFASGIALYFLDNHFLEVGNFLETFHIVIGFFAMYFFIGRIFIGMRACQIF